MKTRAVRIKLKPGSGERVREWATEITRRKGEALATLRNETIYLECFFLEHAVDGDYLIGVITAESFEASKEAVQKSLHDIDAYHKQFQKDAWESGESLELLVNLDRLNEL
jgi:hypothetical protein